MIIDIETKMKEVEKIDEILEKLQQSFGVEGPNKRNLVIRPILKDSVKISRKNYVKMFSKKNIQVSKKTRFSKPVLLSKAFYFFNPLCRFLDYNDCTTEERKN